MFSTLFRNAAVAALLFALPSLLCAQIDSTEGARRGRVDARNGSIELRAGFSDDIFAAAELRFQLLDVVTGDLFGLVGPAEGGAGITLWIIPEVGVQGSIGLSTYSETLIDGPAFSTDYVLGGSAALRFPLGRKGSSLFATMVLGVAAYVDADYCYNCGFIEDPLAFTPMYRSESRLRERLSIGFGWLF